MMAQLSMAQGYRCPSGFAFVSSVRISSAALPAERQQACGSQKASIESAVHWTGSSACAASRPGVLWAALHPSRRHSLNGEGGSQSARIFRPPTVEWRGLPAAVCIGPVTPATRRNPHQLPTLWQFDATNRVSSGQQRATEGTPNDWCLRTAQQPPVPSSLTGSSGKVDIRLYDPARDRHSICNPAQTDF